MESNAAHPIVLGITGASGAIYAASVLEWLLAEGQRVHVVASPDATSVIRQELNFPDELSHDNIIGFLYAANALLMSDQITSPVNTGKLSAQVSSNSVDERVRAAIQANRLQIHRSDDYFASIASGSYRTSAMVICPCSGSTLASIAHSTGKNLIHRAAEVHLKERRKLVLVTRETPLSLIQIDNMMKVTQAGAIVLPASPGWYHGVRGLRDLVDFVAARILDQLDIPHERVRRWGTQTDNQR